MSIIFVEKGEVTIPDWVRDHDSFRRWAWSNEFPETGRYSWIDDRVWADFTMEDLFTHNLLKGVYGSTLAPIVQSADRGYLFTDGAFFTNLAAKVSTEPDGLFVSFDAVESGRVRFVKSKRKGTMEIQGSPDMAREIVSPSSVRKDTVVLRAGYHLADVREYWLVDVRTTQTDSRRTRSNGASHKSGFQILQHTPDGYVEVEPNDGWLRSDVFDRSFRLTQGVDRLGNPKFTLDVR